MVDILGHLATKATMAVLEKHKANIRVVLLVTGKVITLKVMAHSKSQTNKTGKLKTLILHYHQDKAHHSVATEEMLVVVA